MKIREISYREVHLLEDFLYESIFQNNKGELLPRDIIYNPELTIYIDEFNTNIDPCLVAEVNRKIVGMIWARIFPSSIKGYGYVDNKTPELVISVHKEYRNRGIGTQLIKEFLIMLKSREFNQVSLSVSKTNYAWKIYKKLGFKIIKNNKEDFVMIYDLNQIN